MSVIMDRYESGTGWVLTVDSNMHKFTIYLKHPSQCTLARLIQLF